MRSPKNNSNNNPSQSSQNNKEELKWQFNQKNNREIEIDKYK